MILKLLAVLTLLMFCCDAKAVSVSDSEWLCKSKYQVGDIQNVIEDRIKLKESGEFGINTTISFIDIQEQTKSQLIAKVSGIYTYTQGSLIYGEISGIDVEVIIDDIGFLTSGAITGLKKMLNQNSEAKYKTVSLTSDQWISVNSISGERLTCLSTASF